MSPQPLPASSGRLAVFAVLVCLLAVAAAVVSFTRGSLLGVIWVLMAGLASNMAWYYLRKARSARVGADGADGLSG